MFWTKKKKIVVDAFVDNENIAEFPIESTSKYLPEWFLKLKPTHQLESDGHELLATTFKRCDGMLGLINKTFTLPMWSDLSIKTEDDGNYRWKYPSGAYNYGVEHHPNYQLNGAFDPLVHVKIKSPWVLKEKTGIQFLQSRAFYSFNEDTWIAIPPGVVDYKYQHSTHINVFLERNNQFLFEAGQPLMYITPLTEKDVEIKTHVVSAEEYKSLVKRSVPNTFIDFYKKTKKRRCPITGKS